MHPSHLQDSQEKLDAGVAAIEKLIDQELGPLIDMRRFERDQPRERVSPHSGLNACSLTPPPS